jgi:Protein of unknown function (DUF3618)
MTEPHDTRNSEQIQGDIERTRAAMGETLESIRHKLSPGELFEQALDYFKSSGPSQFTSNLGDTVKNNPLPVTLIGLGIGWLMMSGSRDTDTPPTGDTASGIGQRVSAASSSVADRAGQMMQGARERAGAARERIGEMTHGAREHSGETRERMGEAAQHARNRMGDAAGHLRYQVRSQSVRGRDTFNYLRDEQPLILGVLGFALGAAIGAGLPATRREDELMGEIRDEYIHKAREMGEEQLDKAKQVVAAAGRAAQEQLQSEGVTLGNADEQARQATETVERVVQASRDAAEQEARNQGLTSSS